MLPRNKKITRTGTDIRGIKDIKYIPKKGRQEIYPSQG